MLWHVMIGKALIINDDWANCGKQLVTMEGSCQSMTKDTETSGMLILLTPFKMDWHYVLCCFFFYNNANADTAILVHCDTQKSKSHIQRESLYMVTISYTL